MIYYDGYSLECRNDFTYRYVQGNIEVGLFFDPGGTSEGPPVTTLWGKPVHRSANATDEDVERATRRIVEHLQSVGYKVEIF